MIEKYDKMLNDYEEEEKFQRKCSSFIRDYVILNLQYTMEFYEKHNPEFVRDIIYEWVQDKRDREFNGEIEDVDIDLECNEIEIFEYWHVDDWLYRRLKERNEIVFQILDFNVWGRRTTGQALCMDKTIREIVKEKVDWL